MFKKFLFCLNIILSTTLFGETIYDYLEQAESSMVHQNYYEAVEYYKEALSLNSNDIEANKGLSNAYFMLMEYQEALIYIDKCIVLDKNNLELQNLKGRVLTALEDYRGAETIYNNVLNKEMYNISAQSGLAELRLVDGDLKGSLSDFEKIIRYSPNSRRLLLTLVFLYDKKGDEQSANEAIQKAIRYYPEDPIVLETAVKHYLDVENYTGAALYMDELLKQSDNNDNNLLHAQLLIKQNNLDGALNAINLYLQKSKDNPDAYYMAAVVLNKMGDYDRSLSLIERSKELQHDDEIYRFFSEMVMHDLYLLKDEKRSGYSQWYIDQGKQAEERYYYNKAKNFYSRGIGIDPLNVELRKLYAGILKKTDYREKYIRDLESIIEQFGDDKDIQDIIMIEKSLPEKPLYSKWGGERWVYSEPFSISFFIDERSNETHQNSTEVINSITRRFLDSNYRYVSDYNEIFNGKFSQAYNMARSNSSDYFVVIDFSEGSRTFWLNARLFLTKSGRELNSFTYLKTGNNRIFNSFESLAEDLNNFMPIVGTVLDIKGNEVLIDTGMDDKIDSEMVLDVVKKGSYFTIPDEPYIDYNRSQHLGKIELIEIGESMSSGTFTPDNSFNLLNIGDNFIYVPATEETEEDIAEESVIIDSELIDQLLRVN